MTAISVIVSPVPRAMSSRVSRLRNCIYCGRLSRGTMTCQMHADLPALDRAPRDRFDTDALALERDQGGRPCGAPKAEAGLNAEMY